MDDRALTASPQLVEANRRLYELRAQVQAKRQAASLSTESSCQGGGDHPWKPQQTSSFDATSLVARIEDLPEHLGWGSEALTAAIRRRREAIQSQDTGNDWLVSPPLIAASGAKPTENNRDKPSRCQRPEDWVKLYPDIGLGMLRQEQAAPGRLWLLLRHLDTEGRGALRIDIVTKQLTEKTSKLRLCCKRQLRNLLNDGEGTFWVRDEEHIWLYSAARVAHALDVEKLTGRPVALPIAALLNGIGRFRAHLYTAFHSGRTKDTPRGSQAMPIARSTMAELSGVGASSQRAYEAQTAVEVQANFAVGEQATKENQENRAWQQGQALFELKDYRGHQGKRGQTYLAWQLPNTYIGEHPHRPRGRQKRINRKLKDLVMKGMPGNVGRTSETRKPRKVYYPNGKLAAKAYGRDPDQERFWRRHRTRNGRFELWQQLGGC